MAKVKNYKTVEDVQPDFIIPAEQEWPGIGVMARDIHAAQVEAGFWENPREIGTMLMLVTSELAEALEADRHGRHSGRYAAEAALDIEDAEKFRTYFTDHIKDSFEDEVSDAIIRLLDLCGAFKIDIQRHIDAKLRFNKSRGKKHGKAY